ncbi:MAG: uroporphyrinogen-III C-methyltransferase [Phycisphaerales bacterium]|nr:uroporphyrinogen-III C-methyltransferase [Phycisphaerales bacterium]
MSRSVGIVYLVGAGPGDPGLITVKGLECLRSADVILHDRLTPLALLEEAKVGCEIVDVGKTPGCTSFSQAEICALMVEKARQGHVIVRLKGGDPFVFGRGLEELSACREGGIDCVVVPGVTSAVGVPASVGVPVTHRKAGRSFVVVTGRTDDDAELPPHDYKALAGIDTIVLLMGRSNLKRIAEALIAAGRDPVTPVVCIASGTTDRERSVTATLETIAEAASREDLQSPAVTVIGETAAFAEEHLAWSLRRADGRSLAGRRVVITQALSSSSELQRLLRVAGARVVHCPLIQITYPERTPELDDVFEKLSDVDWVVFSSVHGVRGFWRCLDMQGLDARAIGRCQVAALGPGTARALERYGVHADLIPDVATAEYLVDAILLRERLRLQSGSLKVLFPHGNLALPTVADGLRAAGADVREAVIYVTEDATPSPSVLDQVKVGVDAILFCSPSAVQRFAKLALASPGAVLGCIGPTTAAAASELGYSVDIIPDRPGSAGLVDALADHFQMTGVET